MPIWFKKPDLEAVQQRSRATMMEHLDIRVTEIGEDFLRAEMPVDHRTKQPVGLLHGGASVALAESVASTAASMVVNIEEQYCVGIEINANHVNAATSGTVVATARPIHLGKTTQVWETRIEQEERLICISRMTAMVIQRKSRPASHT